MRVLVAQASQPVLLLLLASHAFAAAPVITELRPRGAELGRPFTLTAIGRNLGEGARISSTMPASFTSVVAQQVMGGVSFLGGKTSNWILKSEK